MLQRSKNLPVQLILSNNPDPGYIIRKAKDLYRFGMQTKLKVSSQ